MYEGIGKMVGFGQISRHAQSKDFVSLEPVNLSFFGAVAA
jgi:hypothetical protein